MQRIKTFFLVSLTVFALISCVAPSISETPDVVGIDAPAERILESQTAFLEFMTCAVVEAPEEGRPAIQKIVDEAKAIEPETWKNKNQQFTQSAQLFTLEFGSKCTKTTAN